MRGTPVPLTDFHGGVNTKAADFLVDTNEARDCLNVVSTERGSIKKRNGCPAFSGSPNVDVNSLAGIEVVGPFLIAIGTTVIKSVGTTGTMTDITGAATVTDGVRWEVVEAPTNGGQGPVWMMNGTDPPLQWTGAGNVAAWTAAAGVLPNGKYLIYFKNKVWVAGISANPSRLIWSDVGNPRSWTAANVVDLDPNDGDVITGLGTLGPYLLVFKRNKIFRIYDLDTGANTVLSSNIGAASHRSIVESPLGTFFLTNDKGVFLYTGSSLKQLSEHITPTLDGIVPAKRENAAGIFYQNHYYLSITQAGGTTNNLTLDYDAQLESWWFHSNTSNQFALWRRSSIYELFVAQTNGSINQCYVEGGFTDTVVVTTPSIQFVQFPYKCFWLGAWLTFTSKYPEPYRNKRWRQIHVDGSGVVDAYLGKDYLAVSLLKADIFGATGATSTTFGGTDFFGGGGTFGGDAAAQSRARIYSEGVARAFSIQFQATTSTSFEVDAYTPFITPRQN